MIQANELRIGNRILIKKNDNEVWQLVETCLSATELLEIALLVSVGFGIKMDDKIFTKRLGFGQLDKIEIFQDELNDSLVITRKFNRSGPYVLIFNLTNQKFEFTFLHEFQNLWFTLFKEELPILSF